MFKTQKTAILGAFSPNFLRHLARPDPKPQETYNLRGVPEVPKSDAVNSLFKL
jgi:hypothetical protein